MKEAAELLASVLGQDLEGTEDGSFRIARKVTKDRVISTVDPEARHGRKTSARAFDGYRGHIAVDPDSEMITGTTVTAGNEGDAAAAPELLDDLVGDGPAGEELAGEELADELAGEAGETRSPGQGPAVAVSRPKGSTGAGARSRQANKKPDKSAARAARAAERAARRAAKLDARRARAQQVQAAEPCPAVYGDAAYGAGELLAYLQENGTGPRVKAQPPSAPGGVFTKDRFVIDLGAGTVACPAGNTAPISFDPHILRPERGGNGPFP